MKLSSSYSFSVTYIRISPRVPFCCCAKSCVSNRITKICTGITLRSQFSPSPNFECLLKKKTKFKQLKVAFFTCDSTTRGTAVEFRSTVAANQMSALALQIRRQHVLHTNRAFERGEQFVRRGRRRRRAIASFCVDNCGGCRIVNCGDLWSDTVRCCDWMQTVDKNC